MESAISLLGQILKKYLFTLNTFIKTVMGFTASHISKAEVTNLQPSATNQLTAKEIEVLLSIIKKTSFLGEDIEPLYNMVVKLQNQYTEQNNTKL